MIWNPIGTWEQTLNKVLKLTAPERRLKIITNVGTRMRISFKENDFRYTIDKCAVFCCQNDIEIEK